MDTLLLRNRDIEKLKSFNSEEFQKTAFLIDGRNITLDNINEIVTSITRLLDRSRYVPLNHITVLLDKNVDFISNSIDNEVKMMKVANIGATCAFIVRNSSDVGAKNIFLFSSNFEMKDIADTIRQFSDLNVFACLIN